MKLDTTDLKRYSKPSSIQMGQYEKDMLLEIQRVAELDDRPVSNFVTMIVAEWCHTHLNDDQIDTINAMCKSITGKKDASLDTLSADDYYTRVYAREMLKKQDPDAFKKKKTINKHAMALREIKAQALDQADQD